MRSLSIEKRRTAMRSLREFCTRCDSHSGPRLVSPERNPLHQARGGRRQPALAAAPRVASFTAAHVRSPPSADPLPESCRGDTRPDDAGDRPDRRKSEDRGGVRYEAVRSPDVQTMEVRRKRRNPRSAGSREPRAPGGLERRRAQNHDQQQRGR